MVDHDTELMLRVRDGETAAYRELFDRHYARAVNIAYRSLGDRDLAEDIAMEAFARVFESRQSYRGDAKFSTFLYRVLINLCINASKSRAAADLQNLESVDMAAPPIADPAEAARRSEVADAVRRAVLGLPSMQRNALVLTRYEEMSYRDAAAAMRISVKALESLLHRAKQKLRESLKEYV